jgi:hypothetical protein
MQTRKSKARRPNKESVTVTQAARVLHVSRGHLSYVIHGKRKAPRLLALYHDLISMRAKNKPSTQSN